MVSKLLVYHLNRFSQKPFKNRYDYYSHFTHEIKVQIEGITHSGSLIQYSIVSGEFGFSSNEGLC